jgi:ABC-2 type transport system permease protein
MFAILVRYRLLAASNAARSLTPRQRWISVVLSLVSLALAAGVYGGFRLVMLFRGTGSGGPALAHELVYATFLFMLAGSVPFLAATLLHPGDLALLGTAPVRPAHVLAVRLVEGATAGALQFAPIGAPALAACCAGLGYSGSQWLLLLPVAVVLIMLPAAATAALLLAAVAVLGPERVRGAVAAVNVVLGSLVCLTAVSQVTGLRMQEGLAGLAAGSASPSGWLAKLPPWSWLAEAIVAPTSGDPARYAAALGMAGAVTIALSWLAIAIGARFLTDGRLSGADHGRIRARAAAPRSDASAIERHSAGPLGAMVAKDMRYILRDTLLLSQAGMPMILYLVPFVMAINPVFRAQTSSDELFAFGILMVLAVLYMQASILSLSSVGLEGRAFWLILGAPNRIRTALAAKWLVSWALSAASGVTMVVLSGLAFVADANTVAVLAGSVAISAGGLCGIGVGLAAALPRFTFENPAHRVSPLAIVLGFGLGVAYSAFAWGVLGATWYAGAHWPVHASAIHAAGLGVFGLATLVAVLAPLSAGSHRLGGLEWEH